MRIAIWFALALGPLFLVDPFLLGAQSQTTVTIQDAIVNTLRLNPGVQVEKEKVNQSRALVTKTTGAFDWVVFGNAASSHEEDNDVSVNTSFGATKRFRSGIEITPSFSNFESSQANSQFIERSGEIANVKIRIPLWRGLGPKYVGAEEHAASFNWTASKYLSKHNISNRISATAIRFWECLGALKVIDVLDDSEKRSREIVDLVQLLVEGGELNPVYLGEATGRYYEIKGDVGKSQATLYSARQALAASMGHDPASADALLPMGVFPPLINPENINDTLIEVYGSEALKNRGDYQAAVIRIEAQDALLHKARNDKKPRIDFILDGGYVDVEETFLNSLSEPLHQSLSGPVIQGKLNFEFPLRNHVAKGEVRHRLSKKKEANLKSSELASMIKAETAQVINLLRSSIREIDLAEQSKKAYFKSVKQERSKIGAGTGSLNYLIRLEEKFTEARISHARALQKYAIALVRLRFTTGTILKDSEDEVLVQTSTLMELPTIH